MIIEASFKSVDRRIPEFSFRDSIFHPFCGRFDRRFFLLVVHLDGMLYLVENGKRGDQFGERFSVLLHHREHLDAGVEPIRPRLCPCEVIFPRFFVGEERSLFFYRLDRQRLADLTIFEGSPNLFTDRFDQSAGVDRDDTEVSLFQFFLCEEASHGVFRNGFPVCIDEYRSVCIDIETESHITAGERCTVADAELTGVNGALADFASTLQAARDGENHRKGALENVEKNISSKHAQLTEDQSKSNSLGVELSEARDEYNALELQKRGNVVRLEKLSSEKIQLEEERGQLEGRLSEFKESVAIITNAVSVTGLRAISEGL